MPSEDVRTAKAQISLRASTQSHLGLRCPLTESLGIISRVERKTVYSNSNIFLKHLFRGNFDPFVNNANLSAIAHTSNGT